MAETLHRHWVMLRQIPRAPRRTSAKELHDKLEDLGYDIDKRSVERDLHKLSRFFPLCTDRKKPAGWWWEKGAAPLDIPGMDPHTAITFRLAEEQLARQLPRSTLKWLEPHFRTARKTLKAVRRDGLPAWAEKVRVIPRGQALEPARVDPVVIEAVYDALLHERRLEVRYRRRGDQHVTQSEVSPLGLVFRDTVGYLVCVFEGHEDVRQLALHRLERASVGAERRRVPRGFTVDAYVEAGNLSFLLDKRPLNLVARFHPDAAAAVVETPLAADQGTSTDDDGWVRVKARVTDTRVLRGWLLSFGSKVEVLAPKRLRDAFALEAAALARRYGAS